MKVPFVDVKAQYMSIKAQIDAVVAQVFEEGLFIGGHWVDDFGKEFARYLGVNHCIGCANGTDSLEMALKVLGIGEGDEVIVPATSWISTSSCVSSVGARVVFADVLPNLFTIDPADIQRKITSKTKAIIPVHLYGLPADMPSIMNLAQKYNLWVIEDCAQSVGAQINGKMTGTFGHVSSFSFYPTKNLGAYGDAGALVCNDSALAENIRIMSNHGQKSRDEHIQEGRNSRLDTLQAALLFTKIGYLDQWNEKRIANAELYHRLLKGKVSVQNSSEGFKHVYHIFSAQVDHRDKVIQRLHEKGIFTGVHFPHSLPSLKPYQYLGHSESDFPVSSQLAKTTLSLPIYPELSSEQIEYVAKSLLEVL